MSPRRDRHQIATQILKEAMEGIKKTNIMYRCNLSFAQLKYYLEALDRAGLLSITKDIYKTTDKAIEAVRKLDDAIEPFKPIYERPKK